MAMIRRVRAIKSGGILADRSAKDQDPTFLRYNLIYGFNGSGKSTLSRMFGCLQSGVHHEELPEGCNFELELDNDTVFKGPTALTGLEDRMCVFNTDFVDRNLQWKQGRANSIFYISEGQAEVAAQLHAQEALLPVRITALEGERKVAAARDKAVKGYRTERARTLAGALHLGNRRYEAGQLQGDYDKISYSDADLLEPEALKALDDVARLSAPPPPLSPVVIDVDEIQTLVENARKFGELSVGSLVLEEFKTHPTMVPWVKTGFDYHDAKALDACLLCGNVLSAERKKTLAAALDDQIGKLLTDLEAAAESTGAAIGAAVVARAAWPKAAELDLSIQPDYPAAIDELGGEFKFTEDALREALRVVKKRRLQPTNMVDHTLPSIETLLASLASLTTAIATVNDLIAQHNAATADFDKRQDAVRETIKKHYLAEDHAKYALLREEAAQADTAVSMIEIEIATQRQTIADLSAQVKLHGPAAEQITKLVRAYLGHGELTIVAADEGYELHRHGSIVKGPPSEGEKTAIALCYFLSTLESDGRDIKNLIVVVDDPISSLDTRAMNYACSLVRTRLREAGQVFILTHNQHCMNEFKKAWRGAAEAGPGKTPSATLLFIDVKMPAATGRRSAEFVAMPSHLKGYDSEYHFLCHKVMQFEEAADGHSDYWFMMPNVIRRVLELFLAFKVPGSHNFEQKLDTMSKRHTEIDPVRITALNRLMQVESHTDTLEDLIAHSSMTIEETRDANAALLELMATADNHHVKAIRKQCKAA